MLKNPLQSLVDDMEGSLATLLARKLSRERTIDAASDIIGDTLRQVHDYHEFCYLEVSPESALIDKLIELRKEKYEIAYIKNKDEDKAFLLMDRVNSNDLTTSKFYENFLSAIDASYALSEERKEYLKAQTRKFLGEDGDIRNYDDTDLKMFMKSLVSSMPNALDRDLYLNSIDYFLSEKFLKEVRNHNSDEIINSHLLDVADKKQRELIEQDRKAVNVKDGRSGVSVSEQTPSYLSKLSSVAVKEGFMYEEKAVANKIIKDGFHTISSAVGLTSGKPLRRVFSCGQFELNADEVISAKAENAEFKEKTDYQQKIKEGEEARELSKTQSNLSSETANRILVTYKTNRVVNEKMMEELGSVHPVNADVLKTTSYIKEETERELKDIDAKLNPSTKDGRARIDDMFYRSELLEKRSKLKTDLKNLNIILDAQNKSYDVQQKTRSTINYLNDSDYGKNPELIKNHNQEYIAKIKDLVNDDKKKNIIESLGTGITRSNIIYADYSSNFIRKQIKDIARTMNERDYAEISESFKNMPAELKPIDRKIEFLKLVAMAKTENYIDDKKAELKSNIRAKEESAIRKIDEIIETKLKESGKARLSYATKQRLEEAKALAKERVIKETGETIRKLESLKGGITADNFLYIDVDNPSQVRTMMDLTESLSEEELLKSEELSDTLPPEIKGKEVVEIIKETREPAISEKKETGIELEIREVGDAA